MPKKNSVLANLAAERQASLDAERQANDRIYQRCHHTRLYGQAEDRAQAAIDAGDGKVLAQSLIAMVEAAGAVEAIGTIADFYSSDGDSPFSQMEELATEWMETDGIKGEVGKLFELAMRSPRKLQAACREILAERVLSHDVYRLVGAFGAQARARQPHVDAPAIRRRPCYERDHFLLAKHTEAKQKNQTHPNVVARNAWNHLHPEDHVDLEQVKTGVKKARKEIASGL